MKLTNMTSSRRHISAVYNLHTFPKQRSLLQPLKTDPYFHHPVILDGPIGALSNFNDAQIRVIQYAEQIFGDNGIDRLHLVHGPPGPILILTNTCCKISELCLFRHWEK